jgi:hypothetical protein
MDVPAVQQAPARRPLIPAPREPLSPRHAWPAPGELLPGDDEVLLERTLAFSGGYVSDDGDVSVRRVTPRTSTYAGHRFVGSCAVCAALLPAAGEPLADVRAVSRFVSAHRHGDVD